MFWNLSADTACVVEHHFREYHPVEWFVMFEGKENCCDTILAKRTRGYVSSWDIISDRVLTI